MSSINLKCCVLQLALWVIPYHSFVLQMKMSIGFRDFILIIHLSNTFFLFKGSNITNFHCWQLWTFNTHLSFSISSKRSYHYLNLMHSNIWEFSTIRNVSKAEWFVSFIDNGVTITWIFMIKWKVIINIMALFFIS